MPEENYRLKMIAISAASKALRFKEKNPKATEQEIMQHITDNAEEIIKNIDDEEEF